MFDARWLVIVQTSANLICDHVWTNAFPRLIPTNGRPPRRDRSTEIAASPVVPGISFHNPGVCAGEYDFMARILNWFPVQIHHFLSRPGRALPPVT